MVVVARADVGRIAPDHICDRLSRAGYRVVRRERDHVLLADEGHCVLVPTHSAVVPKWTVRAIEWMLEPLLGPKWLIEEPVADDAPHLRRSLTRLRLHAVVRHDAEGWQAFIAEQYEVMTFGASREVTIRRLTEATSLWFGVRPDNVELIEVEFNAS
jgi:predicted RNase H-like HicB family nuclease